MALGLCACCGWVQKGGRRMKPPTKSRTNVPIESRRFCVCLKSYQHSRNGSRQHPLDCRPELHGGEMKGVATIGCDERSEFDEICVSWWGTSIHSRQSDIAHVLKIMFRGNKNTRFLDCNMLLVWYSKSSNITRLWGTCKVLYSVSEFFFHHFLLRGCSLIFMLERINRCKTFFLSATIMSLVACKHASGEKRNKRENISLWFSWCLSCFGSVAS